MSDPTDQSSIQNPKRGRKFFIILAAIGVVFCVLAAAAVIYLSVGRLLLTPRTTVYLEPATTATISPSEMETAARVLSERFKAIGYGSPWTSFKAQADGRIQAQIPTAVEAGTMQGLKAVGLVELVDFGDNPAAVGSQVDTDLFSDPAPAADRRHTILSGAEVQSAAMSMSSSGNYQIEFTLSEKGTKILADFTGHNTGSYLGVVMDKTVIWAPQIVAAIPDGRAVMSGQFSKQEAEIFSAILQSGALPFPLK